MPLFFLRLRPQKLEKKTTMKNSLESKNNPGPSAPLKNLQKANVALQVGASNHFRTARNSPLFSTFFRCDD